MSAAREAILSAVRQAAPDQPRRQEPLRPRQAGPGPSVPPTDLLGERLRELGAEVLDTGMPSEAIRDRCCSYGIRSLIAPDGFPRSWLPPEVEIRAASEIATSNRGRASAGITACELAIAETGTLVLNGGEGQGARWISLLPDLLFCVIEATRVTGSVPEAIRRLRPTPGSAPPPLTFVSGPSATSDIELTRVQGVHGPRRLIAILTQQRELKPS